VLCLSVGATLLAGLASAATAATVPGGPGWRATTVASGTVWAHDTVPGRPALTGAMTGGPPAVPAPGNTSQLNGVTCDPAGHCWAVGSYQHGGSRNEVFGWNGHGWVRASVPEPGRQSGLSAISCPSAGNCLAVGFTSGARGHHGGAEVLHWNGTTWSVATAPARIAGLAALSCAPSGRCWALSTSTNRVVPWNGQQWGAPVTFSAFDGLSGLSCLSATNCWAAGFYVKPNQINLYNLVMHWNGQTWSQVKVPQPPNGGNQLNAISCTSASSCWAGGSDDTPAGRGRNELLRWDGTSWAQVPVPAGPFVNSEVLGLQCRVPGDCWAVGDDEGGTEALHWAGRKWALTPTPDPGGAGFVFSVRCPLADDCLAVGFSHLPPVLNLALHWNGKQWAAV
jgi:hypothetical protein